jgi:CheY-like chemotaxis protein
MDHTERRSLEEQLTQARRMEAVGQLTGGVAHDFNNLLTVVLGNVDLLDRPTNDARQQRQIKAIRHATERGRDLTRQLLAFSRRQQLSPVVLDVNALITGFAPLIGQAVGEAVTVTLELADEPLHVNVDPAQLESALLNLAVNARDAMPAGGALTIAARALDGAAAGSRDGLDAGANWIEIEVRDTGEGMPSDVLARVFEPFFTTKEVGKGSGLGLSQVYGFVRQSGGHMTVDSAPGQGARFKLYLARSAEGVAARPAAEAPCAEVGGSERLLVVEDDPSVLALTVEMLGALGYDVVTATEARRGLDALQTDPTIALVFSDVVMPGGLSGLDLAREARALRPDVRILLTSGYVGDAPLADGDEFPLIDKPYERSALATKIRALLDATPPAVRSRRKRAAAAE